MLPEMEAGNILARALLSDKAFGQVAARANPNSGRDALMNIASGVVPYWLRPVALDSGPFPHRGTSARDSRDTCDL
jgi:hypothetical protein